MANVTYLIGAGASANAIPTVENLPQSINAIAGFVENMNMDFEDRVLKNVNVVKNDLVARLREMATNASNHASIDTYAKKLYITDHSEFKKMKIYLSCYFVLKQLEIKGYVDTRYDTLFASILGSGHSDFPKNVKIVSWNYDSQLELGYLPFAIDTRINTLGMYLNMHSKNCFRGYDNCKDFSVFKLNGTANFKSLDWNQTGYFVANFSEGLNKDSLLTLLTNYHNILQFSDTQTTGLSFAWEGSKRTDSDIVEATRLAVQDSEILVVIGYSFPFFNRQVDRLIFKDIQTLRRVYIQNLNPDSVIESFESIRPDFESRNIIAKHSCGQFYLPPEL